MHSVVLLVNRRVPHNVVVRVNEGAGAKVARQRPQVTHHSSSRLPQESVTRSRLVRGLCITRHEPGVIDSPSLRVGAAQRAEVHHAGNRTPNEGPAGRAVDLRSGKPHDLAGSVDTVGSAVGPTVLKSAEIGRRSLLEKRARLTGCLPPITTPF